MGNALFLRLLSSKDKALEMVSYINGLNEGRNVNFNSYIISPNAFRKIPGSAFAYWISEQIRHIFSTFPPFEGSGRTAKQGLATADDFRFLRLDWEVSREKIIASTQEITSEEIINQTFQGKYWVSFAKGGAYSPYYADLHLVVNWQNDAEALKNFKNPQTGKSFSYLRNTSFYFLAGLTWSRRTTSGISIRVLPQGCIFADKGPAVFANPSELPSLLGLMNTPAFEALVASQLGAADTAARSYEVGLIQNTPVPNLSNPQGITLGELAMKCVYLKRNLDMANETSHVFYLPALLQVQEYTLREYHVAWQTLLMDTAAQLGEYQCEINNIVFHLYNLDDVERQNIENALENKPKTSTRNQVATDEEDEIPSQPPNDIHKFITNLISYIMGCSFGRWDIQFATGSRSKPDLPDSFAFLPVCSPGMLTGNDGQPLLETPPYYPLAINWDGILVDDPDHQEDVISRVQNTLAVIWKERAEAIEQEACHILGIKELRDYFRRPSNGGFWTDHIQRYSKSRRKAPIYWLLQSSKKNYAVWLYYHRLTKDTLFKVLNNYVEPKIRRETAQLEQIRIHLAATGTAGHEAKKLERQLERQENFLSELEDFRDKLRRAADLNLEPDLNDGVVLNIAPLWELVPWSEAKKYWEELCGGKYEWSSVSKQLREKGLV